MRVSLVVLAAAFVLPVLADDLPKSLVLSDRGSLPSVGDSRFYGYRTPTEGPGDSAFASALNAANAANAPLLLIWSNEGCEHCGKMIADFTDNASEISRWLASSGAVCAYFKDNSAAMGQHASKAAGDAWEFATYECGAPDSWPLVVFYYQRPDSGKTVTSAEACGSETFAAISAAFDRWKQDLVADAGRFADVVEPGHRYEAEPSTGHIDVGLVRDSSDAEAAARVVLVWPDQTAQTNDFTWCRNVAQTNVGIRFEHPVPTSGEIGMTLVNLANGRTVSANRIACTGALAPTADNPLWIGERTSEDLEFGEWTVDLDVATGRVARAKAEGTDAYTIVAALGSKWCHDCANTTRNFLALTNADGTVRFDAWAKSRNIALVAVDVPNFTANTDDITRDFDSPCLLSRTPYSSTLAFEFPEWGMADVSRGGADPELAKPAMRSGLGYLTRKGVSDEEATERLRMNRRLLTANTSEGGFHRPEDTNKFRTGVPIFILLRADGTVAGRFMEFASKSPLKYDADGKEIASANFDCYIARLEEMLANAGDAGEIENDDARSTGLSIASETGVAEGRLSHADTADVFGISGASKAVLQRFAVERTSGGDADIAVEIQERTSDGGVRTIATASGKLSDGVDVSAAFETDALRFVRVRTSGADWAAESVPSTVRGYRLSASRILLPQDDEATVQSKSGRVVMRIEEGVLYRISGIVGGVPDKLEAEGDLYRGMVGEDIELTLSGGAGGTVTFQKWNPGRIEFLAESQRVFERDGTGIVKVVRSDGGSGWAGVRVKRIASDPVLEGRYVWTDTELTWESGSSGTNEVGFAILTNGVPDHAGSFVLKLEKLAGCLAEVADTATNVVTITDTDAPALERSAYEFHLWKGFVASLSMAVANVLDAGRVVVRRQSGLGEMPSGLRVSYDAEGSRLVVGGTAAMTGEFELSYELAEMRSSGPAVGPGSRVRITVEDPSAYNPYLGRARPNAVIPLYAESASGGRLLAGTLSLAVTASGKISARYAGTEPGGESFAGGWSGLDTESGVATAVLVSSEGSALSLELDAGGGLAVGLDPAEGSSWFASGPEGTLSGFADFPEQGVYGRYAGNYNVTFPTNGVSDVLAPGGTPTVMLRFVSEGLQRLGTVVYAGVLADGSSFSGSGSLAVGEDDSALLPVFSRTARNVLGATLSIAAGAKDTWDDRANPGNREVIRGADGAAAYCLHRDGRLDYLSEHLAYGSWFSPGVSPRWIVDWFYSQNYGEGVPLSLSAGGVSGVLDPEEKVFRLEKTQGLTFSCNRQTGVFSGRARIETADGRTVIGVYRGVLMPGWTRNCACGYDVVERPFGSGALWYKETLDDGTVITRGLPVDIDVLK